MLKLISKNFRILVNAIGKEPIDQVISNGLRKILGLKPKSSQNFNKNLNSERKKINSYQEYLQSRKCILNQKPIELNESNLVAFIIISDQSVEYLADSLSSITSQRVRPQSVKIVNKNSSLYESNIEVYDSLEKAISEVQAEYVCIANANHIFHSCYLQECITYLKANEIDILHTCYEQLNEENKVLPCWLPQLNDDLLFSYNYIGQNIIIKRTFGEKLNWFSTSKFTKTYIYDFLIRAVGYKARFHCIPDILYSHAKKNDEELLAERKVILENYLNNADLKGEITYGLLKDTLRIKYEIPKKMPLVSIIIPFKDKHEFLKVCIESIQEKTAYPNYEIILADNRSEQKATKDYLKQLMRSCKNVKYLHVNLDFNFSAINNYAVAKSKGEYLLFLNNDTQVISRNWLIEMVRELQGLNVGVVGAKLLYADNTVQHAGVIYGIGHVAGHAFRYLQDSDNGHMMRANLAQKYSAVTAACLLTKRNLFNLVEGFDEECLAIAYNDVDLCLKIRQQGYFTIYTPYSKLYHFESKSRKSDLLESEVMRYRRECQFMHENWGVSIRSDEHYHPHLNKNKEDFSLVANV